MHKSKSKKNLFEIKGEDSKLSLINELIENAKKDMKIIDSKVATYEILCNEKIKKQINEIGCNNEKKELSISNYDMSVIDIKKKIIIPLETSSIEVQFKGIEKNIQQNPIQDYHFNKNSLIIYKGNELSIEGNPSDNFITKKINNELLSNTFDIEILNILCYTYYYFSNY